MGCCPGGGIPGGGGYIPGGGPIIPGGGPIIPRVIYYVKDGGE